MEKLILGVEQFRRTQSPASKRFFEQLASRQQRPTALFITCSDSRVHPNLITQTDPGDLFLIRNAGNLVPPYGAAAGGEAATIEYSVEVLGVRAIVICGHSQCGAIRALLSGESLDGMPAVKAWCGHAEATRRIVRQKYAHLAPEELAVAAAEENVLVQMSHLSTHPCVAARLSSGELRVYGWYYDIGSGEVLQYEESQGCFAQIAGQAHSARTLPLRGERRPGEGAERPRSEPRGERSPREGAERPRSEPRGERSPREGAERPRSEPRGERSPDGTAEVA